MPHPIDISVDELRLGWRRLTLDRPHRAFVTHPNLLDWIGSDLDRWLDRLRQSLATGYAPRASRLCLVPKSPYLLRPGSFLEIEDEVVYNTLVGRLLPLISRAVLPLQGDPDVANQLQADPAIPLWIRRGVHIWKQWRETSLAKLEQDTAFVAFADITGFYDNIDLDRLSSDLRSLGAPEQETNLLHECLRRWSHPRNKGIPQGYSASDILAKVYLTFLDRALRNEGFVHLRYVDDIRIFCPSRLAARMAIRRLVELLYFRGLTPQSAKTLIKPKQVARLKIDGITPMIQTIHEQLLDEIEQEFGDAGDYLAPSDLMKLLGDSEGPSVAVLERAFRDNFSSAGPSGLSDASLFHFLLYRLAAASSREAVAYCIDALRSHPEETVHILHYFDEIELEAAEIQKVAAYLVSDEAIHDYQRFQVLRWFYDHDIDDETVLRQARAWFADNNREPWLRSFALAYLGRHGDLSDLELIEQRFGVVASDVEKAECVAALARLERTRRNSFYRRVEAEGFLIASAVRRVKSKRAQNSRSGETKEV